MRRPETALACGVTSLFLVAALPDYKMAGSLGQWASTGLHTAFGHGAWLVPAWLADRARRAWMGAPRDPRRTASWVFHASAACMTLDLFAIRGGWVGEQCASLLAQTIGVLAYAIALGIWLVAVMRALGPRRVQQITAQATVIARQALAQRPALLLPMSTQPLRAEIVDMPPELAPVPMPTRPPMPAPEPVKPVAPPAPPQPPAAPVQRAPSHWQLPDARMLPPPAPHHVDETYLAQAAQHLAAKLSSYEIRATVAPAREQGSLVHRFDVSPAHGQKLAPILDRQEDLEVVFGGLRIIKQAGGGKVGLEIPVPESHRAPIQMREVLDSPTWASSNAALAIALGVTTAGKPIVVDLAEAPHLLVAGTTGAGKSVGLHVMLASLLLRHTPADLQLVLIDPKFVEFAVYRDLPHLRAPIANEQEEALALLRDACDEMDARYRRFVEAGVRNIVAYNALGRDRMPRIVIVIEEYADLTSVNRDDVEMPICRLAQKARAAGIHVILATQRPSTDVITGRIKANFDGRIAYRVASHQDSSTALGSTGAERLMGRGDSLVKLTELGTTPIRVHGAYIEEVRPICDVWRAQTTSTPAQQLRAGPPPLPARAAKAGASDSDEDTSIDVFLHAPGELARVLIDAQRARGLADAKTDELERTVDAIESKRSADIYDRAVAYARELGHVSGRKLEDKFSVGSRVSGKLITRMLDDALIAPGGPNNSYRYIGPTA